MSKPTPFKIGITMAGAVSAGAYTAGVIDYLLETLQLWEDAKQKNRSLQAKFPDRYLEHEDYDPSVPMHEVQLEVLSGASAGGITGTLTMLSLLEGISPCNRHNPDGKNNKLYQSWVNMADNHTQTTLDMLLQTNDIHAQKVESLLNADPLSIIADNALDLQGINTLPPYIASNIDLILTISNLRGIKYRINFEGKDANAGTIITNHSGFFRYRFKTDTNDEGIPRSDDSLYYVLHLGGKNADFHKKYLKRATLSTGAFPIGLQSQTNTVDKRYIRRYTKYLFGREEGIEPILPDDGRDTFEFDSIDGGLINNEPFGYTLKVLKEKCPEIEEQGNYAVVMVDPFPNYDEEEKKYRIQKDIPTIAHRMFNALRNQVMFKQDEIINALDESDRTRFLIAPSRKENGKRVKNTLASGAMEGFSGFFKKAFREHDFQLGRQNCQSFLRYYFAIKKEDISQKLGVAMNEHTLERFAYSDPPYTPESEGGQLYFPIIPDMKVQRAFDNQYHAAFGADAVLDYPDFPSISRREIEKQYGDKIKNRIDAIVLNLIPTWKLSWLNKFIWHISGLRHKTYTALMKLVYESLENQKLLK